MSYMMSTTKTTSVNIKVYKKASGPLKPSSLVHIRLTAAPTIAMDVPIIYLM